MYRKTLFILLLFCSVVSAQHTYYIDTTGSDSNTGLGTTAGTAWKTAGKVAVEINAGRIVAGDSILFKRGQSWQPTSTTTTGVIIEITQGSARFSSWVTIGAYGSGAKPIISLQNLSTRTAVFRGYDFSHIVLRDMEFRGNIKVHPHYSSGGTSYLLLDSMYFNGAPLRTLGDGNSSSSLTNEIIYWDSVLPVGTETYQYGRFSSAEVRNCLFEQMAGCFRLYASYRDIWYHHNRVINCMNGIDVGQGTKIRIEYNFFYNDGTNAQSSTTFTKVQAQRTIIDSCVYRGNLMVMRNGQSAVLAASFTSGRGDSIYNNTFISNSTYSNNYVFGIGYDGTSGARSMINHDSGYAIVQNYFVANNIIYGGIGVFEHVNHDITYWNGYHVVFNETIDSMFNHNVIFKRNAFYCDGATPLLMKRRWTNETTVWSPTTMSAEGVLGCYVTTGYSQSYDYSITSSNFNTTWLGVYSDDDVYIDPLFVDIYGTDSSDFRLSASSPIKSSGVVIPGYTQDLSGASVPQVDGFVSVGCFQYDNEIPPSPTVTTDAATSIGTRTATLNATINPNGQPTTAWYNWGLDSTVSATTDTTNMGSSNSTSPLPVVLSSLNPNTKYYFRVTARNSTGGTSVGEILNFTTSAISTGNKKLLIKR